MNDVTLRMLAGSLTLIAEGIEDLAHALDHLAAAIEGDRALPERETIER